MGASQSYSVSVGFSIGKSLLERPPQRAVTITLGFLKKHSPMFKAASMHLRDPIHQKLTLALGPGAGGSVQSPAQWIAGSFNVAESWSQSQTESCNGEEGEVICVWHAMHHTAYTVVDSADAQNPCTAPNDGEYVIRSPNKDDPLSGFYCVRGQTNCHVLGSQYWENGPAGGY